MSSWPEQATNETQNNILQTLFQYNEKLYLNLISLLRKKHAFPNQSVQRITVYILQLSDKRLTVVQSVAPCKSVGDDVKAHLQIVVIAILSIYNNLFQKFNLMYICIEDRNIYMT